MLISPDTGNEIKTIPHKREYDIWKNRLTHDEYEQLVAVLTNEINKDEIQTSSWIPGSDWMGTPYQIIYEKACLYDEKFSAFFFGLILWDTVMRHPDKWSFIKGLHENIQGITYFKCKNE